MSSSAATQEPITITTASSDASKQTQEEVKFSLKTYFRYATRFDVFLMVWASICSMVNGASLPLSMWVFGQTLNAFYDYSLSQDSDQLMKDVVWYMFAFFVLGIASGISGFFQLCCWMYSGERQTKKIREAYLKAVLRQDIGWFDTHKSGEFTSVLAADTQQIQDGMSEKVGTMLQHGSSFLVGYIIAFATGWKMTLVLLGVLPLLAFLGGFITKAMSALTSKGLAAYAGAGSVAEEVLSAMRTVAAFGGETKEAKRYQANLLEAEKANIKKGWVTGLGLGVTWCVMFGSYALAFWFGGEEVINGDLQGGDVATVLFSVIIGAFSLGQASPQITFVMTGYATAVKVYKVIDRVPPIDSSSPDGEKPSVCAGKIELKDVKFTYPTRPDVPVLRGLSLVVEPGQNVALVGASGCGKSTVIQLLERFYDPAGGSVMLDGRDLRELNLKWLRNQIGLVSQEPILFATTIRANIAMGGDDASFEDIQQAAKDANAHNFIMQLPNQYDTMVGERGAQLSGGQKQRIAIARALLKRPKVLLLDEATSALDNESEKIVQEALDKAGQGRSTITIAHRLSTIRGADLIYVINEGQLVEQGKHDELMAKQGIYHGLVLAQEMKKKEEEEKGANGPASPLVTNHKSPKTARANGDTIEPLELEADSKATTETKQDELPTVSMGRVAKLNKPEVPQLIVGILAAAANGGIIPAFSIIFAEMLGAFSKTDDDEIREEVRKYCYVFVGLGVAGLIVHYVQFLFFAIAGERLTSRLRALCFDSMLRQDIGWFDKQTTGQLTTKLSNDAALVQGMTGSRLGVLTQSMVTMLAGLVIAFVSAWRMALVVVGTVPFVLVGGAAQMRALTGYSQKARVAYEQAGQTVSEAVENVRTVVSLNKEQHFIDVYTEKLMGPYLVGRKRSWVSGIGFGLSQFFIFNTYAIGFIFGAHEVGQGNITYTDMIRAFSAVIYCAMVAGQNASLAPDAAKARSAAASIFAILDRVPPVDPTDENTGMKPETVTGSVELSGVEFSYPTRPGVKILGGFNLKVKPGQTVALVGPSGCGKSTIVSLLQRFYFPAAGSITVDGRGLETYNLKWLRSQIGIVSQEPVLFATTIKENILYGNPSASFDQVVQASKEANIYDFIMGLPHQFDTVIGEKGAQLSGGQKQRIAIARALIRNPKLLLLDEATSALDTESEKVVQAALDNARKGRTTLVIAHRLSTVRNADVLVVLKGGAVVEQGTHDELMKAKGVYFELVSAQLGAHEHRGAE